MERWLIVWGFNCLNPLSEILNNEKYLTQQAFEVRYKMLVLNSKTLVIKEKEEMKWKELERWQEEKIWGCKWGTAASVTQAMFFLGATCLVKHLRLSLPTLQISQRWPHQLTPLSFSLTLYPPSLLCSPPSLSLDEWLYFLSVCGISLALN